MEEMHKSLSPNEAASKILSIQDTVMRMGANDEENTLFRKILEALENGAATPEKAVRDAERIAKNKQSYH